VSGELSLDLNVPHQVSQSLHFWTPLIPDGSCGEGLLGIGDQRKKGENKRGHLIVAEKVRLSSLGGGSLGSVFLHLSLFNDTLTPGRACDQPAAASPGQASSDSWESRSPRLLLLAPRHERITPCTPHPDAGQQHGV
jgi:hypothetical protein